MTRRRPLRVAISVEPTILGDALMCALHRAGVAEVVNLGTDAPPPASASAPACFDAAVVTIALPDGVGADVVIELPPDPSGAGPAAVTVHGSRRAVDITGLGDVLRLLDAADDYDAG